MHIVYSAFNTDAAASKLPAKKGSRQADTILGQRLQAYHMVCSKYQDEITAIRKYLPHWKPAFAAQ